MEANFTVQSRKSVSCLNTSQKVTPTGLSHNNMVSSPEISVYMTVITKTDGQGAKKRHHIDSGLNATGSYGAERSCARLCGSWESHWWPFAVQSQTHLQNYAFPIDFMLKWLRKKKEKKPLSELEHSTCWQVPSFEYSGFSSLFLSAIHKPGCTF